MGDHQAAYAVVTGAGVSARSHGVTSVARTSEGRAPGRLLVVSERGYRFVAKARSPLGRRLPAGLKLRADVWSHAAPERSCLPRLCPA